MKLLATRQAQTLLTASFDFSWNNWVIDSVDLTKKTLGSTVALSTDPLEAGLTGPVANTIVFDCLPMPVGAVIVGGEVVIETAYAGATAASLSLGIAGATTGLVNATDLKAAASTRVALLLTTALQAVGGANLRATIAYTVANATAGKARVNVLYKIDGRANENIGG
jgi:hypothetical protein